MLDTVASKECYQFIRLMGKNTSHITLECAVLTRPNYAFIGEEISSKGVTLNRLVEELVEIIVQRSNYGNTLQAKSISSIRPNNAENKNYGVILFPEGLIEFVNEMK